MEPSKGNSKTVRKPSRSTASKKAAQSADEERLSHIAVSAYYKAEARGFVPGNEQDDWLAAEAEVKS